MILFVPDLNLKQIGEKQGVGGECDVSFNNINMFFDGLKKKKNLSSGVNFINILSGHFLYESLFKAKL